jgi:hypothetical protein
LIQRDLDIIYIREWRQILGEILDSVVNRKRGSIPVPKRRSTGRRRIAGAPRSIKRRKRIKRNTNPKVDNNITNKNEEIRRIRE